MIDQFLHGLVWGLGVVVAVVLAPVIVVTALFLVAVPIALVGAFVEWLGERWR